MTRTQSARPESPAERFFLPQSLQLATVELDGAEAHHLLHVLRAQVGDRIGLFNGEGEEAIAEITAVRKRSSDLRIIKHWRSATESNQLVLATALPKGDRARWLVEKATELGVSRIIPLRTERSVVEPGSGKLEKLEQSAITACKQCGRSRLPRFDQPATLKDVLRTLTVKASNQLILLAHPQAEKSLGEVLTKREDSSQAAVILIGPEGGFSSEEQAVAITAGAVAVSLGPHILRVETAALAAAAVWASCIRDRDKSTADVTDGNTGQSAIS